MIAEPDVALTDYTLAVECGTFAWLLARRRDARGPVRRWLLLFFAAGAAAALLGGTVHGFFTEATSPDGALLWAWTLIAVGVSALAAWALGAALLFPRRVACAVEIGASVELVGYALIVAFVTDAFALAVANSLPALLFLLVALALEYRRTGGRRVLEALAGLVVMLGGAGVQQLGVGLHAVYFTHNALYHVFQAVGLLLLYRGGAWLVVERSRG